MKILIIGHGRHGKDAFAELLAKHAGISFESSSRAAAKEFIFDELKTLYGYSDFEECYNDRNSTDEMRALWYNLISDYNDKDRARLAKVILRDHDCYVGMRDRDEIAECIRQNLFDLIIWVDATERIEYVEPSTSFNIDKSCADIIVDNNGTLQALDRRARRIARFIMAKGIVDAENEMLDGFSSEV